VGLAKFQVLEIVSNLAKLEADPALIAALQRRSFIEKGLDLIDGSECPLCDHIWDDEQHLREHLKAKLAKSEEARKLQQTLLSNGTVLAQEANRVVASWARRSPAPAEPSSHEERLSSPRKAGMRS
jgi:hypothetical protein